MKTFAAVLCAILATGGIAFAHGTAGGGAVMSGGPVTTQIAMPVMLPSTHFGQPNNNRRRPKPPTTENSAPVGLVWEPKICRPPQYLFTPDGVVQLSGPYSCGINDDFVATLTGPPPLWLMPAFMW
jgi:hypothetical protein